MRDLLALLAGLAVTAALLAVAGRPMPVPGWPAPPRGLVAAARRLVEREVDLVAGADLPGPVRAAWPLLLAGSAAAAGAAALGLTRMPVLTAVAAASAPLLLRGVAVRRAATARARRQDAVVESLRMLRQLLETGGLGLQQCLAVLGERGPLPLRPSFRAITAAGATGRTSEAWRDARERLDEPLFDLLAAAVLVQRPAGGPLGPLLADVEVSAAGVLEVTREAEALQVQARGAAAMIAALPVVFLVAMCLFASPYLEPYRTPVGQAFLGSMLATIGLGHAWMRRWLRLPVEPRLRLRDDRA